MSKRFPLVYKHNVTGEEINLRRTPRRTYLTTDGKELGKHTISYHYTFVKQEENSVVYEINPVNGFRVRKKRT